MNKQNKNKPVIVDLKLVYQQKQELEAALKKRSGNKNRVIREFFGGYCTVCAEIPTKKVSYDVGDKANLIEFYCDKCFELYSSSFIS